MKTTSRVVDSLCEKHEHFLCPRVAPVNKNNNNKKNSAAAALPACTLATRCVAYRKRASGERWATSVRLSGRVLQFVIWNDLCVCDASEWAALATRACRLSTAPLPTSFFYHLPPPTDLRARCGAAAPLGIYTLTILTQRDRRLSCDTPPQPNGVEEAQTKTHLPRVFVFDSHPSAHLTLLCCARDSLFVSSENKKCQSIDAAACCMATLKDNSACRKFGTTRATWFSALLNAPPHERVHHTGRMWERGRRIRIRIRMVSVDWVSSDAIENATI